MNTNGSEIHIKVKSNEKLVGRAYVPDQNFADIYDPMTSLMKGTAFLELDMPYVPKSVAGMK